MKRPTPAEMLSETPCRCGHELGEHRATGKECLHGADELGRNPTCQCEKFRPEAGPSRKRGER